MPPLRSLLLTLLFLSLFQLVGCQSIKPKNEATLGAAVPQAAATDTAKTAPPRQQVAVAEKPEPVAAVAPVPISEETIETEKKSEPAAKVTAPKPPADIWERMRAGYKLTIPDNSRIDREFKWFASHGEYMVRVQDRAEPYLYFIMEEIEKRGLPAELALLPVVESAFQPFAYSHGRAAGLWQFIPSTGRLYGLKQNWWYDGRRDVVSATRAALDYLKAQNERFHGDWELALAAYNAGAGNVQKAIRKNVRRGKPTDFWSLDLPRETRSYVPRLLAVAKLMAKPEAYGINLRPIPNKPYFASIDIQSQLDLALAAEMAGISIEELYLLNPGFNRWATDPDGPHRLQLPLDKVDRFTQKLAGIAPNQRLRWKRYRIKQGDVLGAIARKHNTTVALLQEINKLRGTNIRAGKHLLIPVSSQKMERYSLSSEQRTASIKNSGRKGTRITYEVRPGDTLWEIARSYKVSHRQLAKWNAMAPRDLLHPGQKLVIWKGTRSDKTTITAKPTLPVNLAAGPVNSRSQLSYRVRKGDSLYRIAQRFKVSVADLKQWNALPGKYLQPGQRIKLYVDVTNQAL
jgi:membrane-bound lytic murein transglycosylase D